MTRESQPIEKKTAQDLLRKYVPEFVLQQRGIVRRLGPRAGRIYARMRLLDAIGIRTANQRMPPSQAHSFVFVCFGNIMRSAMAEFLMRRSLDEMDSGRKLHIKVMSAGLHATAGREAHPWAQQAASELGLSLAGHRAKPLTREMVEQADCIFAMDFQNKAELLVVYPEAEGKIYMLSAYGDDPWKYREISDPYLEDLDGTRQCARRLQICIQKLIASIAPAPVAPATEPVASR